MIFIPIHYVSPSKHWCLVSIDVKKKTISYYDSTAGIDHVAINNIQNYLEAEYRSYNNGMEDPEKWSVVYPTNFPLQNDDTECGVFVCMYAEHLSRQVSFDFTVSDTPDFRAKMKYEILNNSLL